MIRNANNRDASRLAEILIFTKRMSYRNIFKDDVVSFNKMQVLDLALEYKHDEKKLENLYVYDDGIVKGLIQYKKFYDKTSGNEIAEIMQLYVDVFFQKQGIGKKLIENCIDYAKKQKIKKVFLWVLKENYSARKFYEKLKFTYDGYNEKFEEGTDVVLVRYTLNI